MGKTNILGSFEHLVLLALVHLGEESYGVTVRQELEQKSGKTISIGAVYATLDRLEGKNLISSRHSGADPARGGKPRRHFKVLPAGELALARSRELLEKMWHGIDLNKERPTG